MLLEILVSNHYLTLVLSGALAFYILGKLSRRFGLDPKGSKFSDKDDHGAAVLVPSPQLYTRRDRHSSEWHAVWLIVCRVEVETLFPASTWQRQTYDGIVSVLNSKDPVDFPCVYATKGFRSREHLYLFLSDPDLSSPDQVRQVAASLGSYLPRSRALGPNTSLVILSPITEEIQSVEEYSRIFWNFLLSLAQHDRSPWPVEIPRQMDSPRWTFCFNGESVFTAALTPAHMARRSRYAPCFCVVFQPKWIFDILFATPERKVAAMKKVRDLVAEFDDVAISPDLKEYGQEDGRESLQYFLMDTNKSTECPFKSLS